MPAAGGRAEKRAQKREARKLKVGRGQEGEEAAAGDPGGPGSGGLFFAVPTKAPGVGGEAGRLPAAITSDHGRAAVNQLRSLCFLPEVLVFDLDDTLWEGDIDRTAGPPFKPGGGGLLQSKKGCSKVTLFRDVPEIMEWLREDRIRGAVASHTSTPRWADSALTLLRTSGGADLMSVCGIRECHGARKTVHLEKIATRAGCHPSEMVFFDNMRYNVQDGEAVQVTSCYTPDGLSWEKVVECLIEFDRRATRRRAGSSGGDDEDDDA